MQEPWESEVNKLKQRNNLFNTKKAALARAALQLRTLL
jgi:hypothetical protein